MNSVPSPVSQCPMNPKNFDPFDLDDPFEAYRELRAELPIFFDEGLNYYIVSRFEDVKAIFDDWHSFSSENAQQPLRPPCAAAKRVLADGDFTAYSGLSARIPPEHTRVRKVFSGAFNPKRYKALAPLIREKTREMLDALAKQDRPDMVAGLAFDLPAITILALLGVPEDKVADVKRWAQSRLLMTWGNPSDEEQVYHAHQLVAYWKYCREVVAERHLHPADDLPGELVAMQRRGEPIDDHEIASFCYSLLIAGHETTTNFIANGFRELLSNRDVWETLVADRAKIPAAMDEVLRISPSVFTWRRRALRPVQVRGVDLPAGANVLLLLGSTNRDEDVFPNADTFALERTNARNHLSFGYGIHYCIGALLGKMQLQIVLEETLERFPAMRLAEQTFEYPSNAAFRGPKSVIVVGLKPHFTAAFDSGEKPDYASLGGKCASLVALTAAGCPVPPGYAVKTAAYAAFLAADNLGGRIAALLEGLDTNDLAAVERASEAVRATIVAGALPPAIEGEVRQSHADLIARCGADVPVAVRSSATAEDMPDASFAGQQDTYLWVTGIDAVLLAVKRCWASLFTARAVTYRAHLGIAHADVLMAVGVQKMINARVAGVAMTLDPRNGDRSKIAVEASYGIGELVVSGEVTPDNFLVDKIMLSTVRSRIADKAEMLVPDGAARALVRRAVAPELREVACLEPEEVKAVARLAKVAERHYRTPQDIEWAIDADLPGPGNLMLLQSRPETVWAQRPRATAAAPAKAGIESVIETLLNPLSAIPKMDS